MKNIVMRNCQSESDNERIRQFLRQVFLFNGRHEICWPLYRWDYWRWHVHENIFRFDLNSSIYLWETSDGSLAAFLHPEGPGEVFLQIHPAFHTPDLVLEMMSVAEDRLSVSRENGAHRLVIWTNGTDSLRHDILTGRGYQRTDYPEYQRRRDMQIPIPEVPLPKGYSIRALGNEDEHPARSWVSWKAFHPEEPDEKYEGYEWYRNVQRAPLYRSDLDLIVVAPDGEFAAFCTLWFDELTETAAFEPVGVHPDHQRRGLGKALMAEGLRRVRDLGATLCAVGSYSIPAGALYASLGFTEYDLSEPWEKGW